MLPGTSPLQVQARSPDQAELPLEEVQAEKVTALGPAPPCTLLAQDPLQSKPVWPLISWSFCAGVSSSSLSSPLLILSLSLHPARPGQGPCSHSLPLCNY